jgi:hypothetical protein
MNGIQAGWGPWLLLGKGERSPDLATFLFPLLKPQGLSRMTCQARMASSPSSASRALTDARAPLLQVLPGRATTVCLSVAGLGPGGAACSSATFFGLKLPSYCIGGFLTGTWLSAKLRSARRRWMS